MRIVKAWASVWVRSTEWLGAYVLGPIYRRLGLFGYRWSDRNSP